MDITSVDTLALDVTFSVMGVPATVTPAGGSPIDTSAIWLQPAGLDVPTGGDFQRREMRRVVALPRADVPSLPLGSTVIGAERTGAPVSTWRVDQIELIDPVQIRVGVIKVS